MSRLTLIVSAVVLFGAAGAATADTLLHSVDVVLKEPTMLVAEWESDRTITVTMVGFVILLGAIIALLQALPTAKSKIITVLLGTAVTLLSGMSNAFFDFDHRQYKAMASQGRLLLAEIDVKKLELKEFPPEQKEARALIFEQIRRHANAIVALPFSFKEHGVPAAARIAGLAGMLVSTAHAQSPAPEWITKLPVDDEHLYFLGQAEGREYLAVVDAARQNGYEQARAYLARRLQAPDRNGVDSASAARYLLDSARVARTYSSFDKSRGTVRAYTLVSLSKKVAESDLRWYGAKTSQEVPPVQQQLLRNSVRTQSEYLRR